MRLGVFSLYWDNIDPLLVHMQQAVCNKFGMQVQQHRINGLDHGTWMDWVLRQWDDVEVMLFIDIDCVPISYQWGYGYSGTLTGAEGCANHIDPSRSYAAPWFLLVPRSQWYALGKPSAWADQYNDVGQHLTEVWRRHGYPVKLLPPTHCEQPRWDLPGRPKAYGIGTTYGNVCYHLFESRGRMSAPFIKKCEKLLGAQTV